MFVRTLALSGLTAASLLLGGCFGSEPSESEMLQALRTNQHFRQGLLLFVVGDVNFGRPDQQRNEERVLDNLFKLIVVEKSACVEAQGSPGYICDFRTGRKQPSGEKQYGPPVKARFFKSGDGWAVEM
jgi:hypothetical protein